MPDKPYTPRYLIIGGTGLIGQSLRRELAGETVFYTSRSATGEKGSIACDILDPGSLRAAFIKADPAIVINATNLAGGVDFCENNPETARRFHLEANIALGKLCQERDACMVLISTDYVFDGSAPPYREEDKPHPLNIYGKMKLEAETWMQHNLERFLVVRTTNVFGWDPHTRTPNFLMGLYFKLKQGIPADIPSYLYGNPTLADNLAQAILELTGKGMKGLYNVVGSSFINRYEWALCFAQLLEMDSSLIREVKNPPEKMVPRPLQSNLDTARFRQACTTPLLSVEQGLSIFMNQMQTNA